MSGVLDMLGKDKVPELEKMFKLYMRAPETIKFLTDKFAAYINSTGDRFKDDPAISKGPIGEY
jgi:hypothetical protein